MESEQEKTDGLERIAEQIRGCPRCGDLVASRTLPVPGTGSPMADVMLIGEAPGREEDRQGKPFVGPAGRTLDELLRAVDLDRAPLFVTNVIKCRPPKNRNPKPDEISNCFPYLEQQIETVRPRAIGTLGATAAHCLLGNRLRLARLRGQVHAYQRLPVVCTYHPAYVRRNPAVQQQVKQELLLLQQQIPGP